jgi:hypothetical protein
MKNTVYGILDESARKWWYHAQLRKQGQVVEARAKERASIRSNIAKLREAKRNKGYAIALRGRHLFFIAKHTYESGYSPVETVALCKFVGIPVLDLGNRDALPAGMPMGFDEGREWVLSLKKKWHR